MAASEHKKIRCGYYPKRKFHNKLPWEKILQQAALKNLEFVEINEENFDSVQDLNLDFMIAKFSDTIPKTKDSNDNLSQRLLEVGKKVRIYDPLQSQQLLFDRRVISEILERGNYPQEVMLPKYVVLNERKDDYTELLKTSNISFPLIVKSVVACGTLESHYMNIIFSEDQLHLHPPPLPAFLGEYYNHDATIFKVYAVGPHLKIIPRHSIRNFEEGYNTPILFDSQQMSEIVDKSKEITVPCPDRSVIEAVRDTIFQLTGLTMYGFDIIRDVKTKRYFLIDINFFPGFGGWDEFPEIFVDYVASLSK